MTKTRNRLNNEQKMEVLALVARGDTAGKISQHFEAEYGFPVSPQTISHTKKSNAGALQKIQERMVEKTADGTAEILNRSRRMLNTKLKRAESDENEIDKLHQRYRDNEISWAEYQRLKEGYKTVSIDSLAKVTKEMHAQTLDHNPDTQPTTDPRALEQLTDAIKNGDAVELQRIIFNGNATTTTT